MWADQTAGQIDDRTRQAKTEAADTAEDRRSGLRLWRLRVRSYRNGGPAKLLSVFLQHGLSQRRCSGVDTVHRHRHGNLGRCLVRWVFDCLAVRCACNLDRKAEPHRVIRLLYRKRRIHDGAPSISGHWAAASPWSFGIFRLQILLGSWRVLRSGLGRLLVVSIPALAGRSLSRSGDIRVALASDRERAASSSPPPRLRATHI